MNPHLPRRLSTRTPVLDHGDQLLYYAARDRAKRLIEARRVEVIGNRRRIEALRVLGPDPAQLPGPVGRKAQAGMPHRHENYWNPRGVFTIDYIRQSLAQEYACVLLRAS